MEIKSTKKGIILVIIGAMLWGVSGTVAQFLFQEKNFSTEWLVNIRLLASGIILISLGFIKKDKNFILIWKNKTDRIKLLVFSILGMLGVQYTYFAAIKHGNAATATILQYLAPVIIIFYLTFKNKKLPSLKQIIAISLALLGTFFIITKGNINSLSISKLALFWGLASAFASALYTVQPVSLINKYGSICIVGWAMLIGGLFFSFIGKPWIFNGTWSFSSILAVLFVIIFGTLVAFCLYLDSLKYIEPAVASILGSFEPLSAAFLSVIWLKESLGLYQWIGTLLIISTTIVLSFSNKK